MQFQRIEIWSEKPRHQKKEPDLSGIIGEYRSSLRLCFLNLP
jgi:hypothetical protein